MRIDTLRVKLFLAIAGGTAALALAGYLVFSWSFDRGFADYLNRADEERLQPLTAALAEGYAREGHWAWIANDRRRWFELLRDTVGLPPVTFDPRLMLFDAERDRLIGRPEDAGRAVLRPITLDVSVIGYVGYVPRPEILESLERLYLKRQHGAFAAIALGMAAAALLLGAGLSQWLGGRIQTLAQATHRLIEGDYAVRLGHRSNDELGRLAADFNMLAHTLDAARKSRQQWIADIAHELRTPLAILRGEIEALEDRVRPLTQDAVRSLGHEAARLARLVEDLHTLSLSDLGALSYHMEAVDLGEVVSEVIDGQRREIAEKGLNVEMSVPAGTVIQGDADRLSQVFSNLLQNSLRYTDAPGVVAVRVEPDARVVWEDSAPGVPEEDLPRLTDRLFRVEGSRSRAGGGSGLGLAIARAIVEAHGGTLKAASSALGGVRFELDFAHHG